jgi:hypothetical protein
MATELRDKLLEVLDECRLRERDELVPLIESDARSPGWTYKDHLAHLSAWRDHAADVLRAARGAGPVPPAIGVEQLDTENARIYAASRDRSAADVVQDAFESYVRLAAELDACSDEVLRGPRPDRPEMETWRVLPGNLETHVAMHLSQLHLEDGDFDAAENTELWAYDVSNRAATDAASRAGSVYNLGCFYARAGLAAPAVERFRTAFAGDLTLLEWARNDPDLDKIRDDPALRQLVG